MRQSNAELDPEEGFDLLHLRHSILVAKIDQLTGIRFFEQEVGNDTGIRLLIDADESEQGFHRKWHVRVVPGGDSGQIFAGFDDQGLYGPEIEVLQLILWD